MPCEWYKNSNTQMHDPDMERLQSEDSASCAVWEWVKGECHRRNSDRMPNLSDDDYEVAARRLGIDLERIKTILNAFVRVRWITTDKRVRSWQRWQTKPTGQSVWTMKQQLEMAEAARDQLKEWATEEVKKEKLPPLNARIRSLKERIVWAE